VLPAFLAPRGWFVQRAEEILGVRLAERTLWRREQKSFVMSFIEVHTSSGWQRYFLPLTLAWEDLQEDGALRTAEWTLAKVREHAKGGALIDAFADPTFCLSLVHCVAERSTVPFAAGELRCEAMEHDEWLGDVALRDVQMAGAETTNTSVVLNDQIFLKAYRRAESGTNPDTEMIGFLMARGFGSIAKHIGTVSYVEAGARTELIALFAYIRNQGDVWSYALDHLERFLAAGAVEEDEAGAPHALFDAQMTTLGKRIGQLHALLASERKNPAFAPEPLQAEDFQAWLHSAQQRIEALIALTRERVPSAAENWRLALEDFVARRGVLLDTLEELASGDVDAVKMRVHGNLHLGKVLLVADDFLVTGFEGDALLPFSERRRKGCALSDLATLVGSLDYIQEQALRKAVLARPEQRERMMPALEHWVCSARTAMLAGYRAGVGDAPCLPRSDAEAERVMRFFRIKRLLRELEHELRGRAQWTAIPLQLLLRETHTTPNRSS
jgi:maltose alpha-D-glucosyltransferase/alpha-amylase